MAEVDLGKVGLTSSDIQEIKDEISQGLYSITIATAEPETVGDNELVLVVEGS